MQINVLNNGRFEVRPNSCNSVISSKLIIAFIAGLRFNLESISLLKSDDSWDVFAFSVSRT